MTVQSINCISRVEFCVELDSQPKKTCFFVHDFHAFQSKIDLIVAYLAPHLGRILH